MKRLATALTMVVVAVLAAACGENAVTGPAVSVSWTPETDGAAGTVYSVALTPSGAPSGVLALKAVRGGRARTIAASRFSGLEGAGSATVTVTGGVIEASWLLSGSGRRYGRVSLPSGSRTFATAWHGTTLVSGEPDGECVLWAQERFTGAWPANGSTPVDFTALASASTQHPRRTTYCLTLELEGR